MKKFRFPLQPVGVLRAHQELRAREVFAAAVHHYVQTEERLAALRRRVAELAEASPAFDHAEIIDATLAKARAELDRSAIAFELVPETFTIQELRGVHEAIRAEPLDPGNFRKKFLRMIEDGHIEIARGKRATASKPANVYRFARSPV